MRQDKTVFDKRYFKYSAKKILPFFIASNIVMLISVFFIYIRKSDYIFLFGDVADLSWGFLTFAYIYPVLLGIFMFRFLFSKKQSDFVGALPLKRSSVFYTGIITGGVACFITCLLVTVLTSVELYTFCGNNIYIAPEIFLLTFLYWFIAYFTVYLLTALAAFLSGTYVTHIILTAVFLLSPAATEVVLRIFTGDFFKKNTSFLPSICGIPYIFFSDNKSGLNSVFGIIYGFVFAILLIIAGKLLFEKRRFEKAGSSYVSRTAFALVRFGIYIPAAFICIFWFIDYGYPVLMFFFVILGVFLCEVLMNRGLRKEMLRGVAVFGIAAVFSLTVYAGLWGFGLFYEGEIYAENADIIKMTVYVPRNGQLAFNRLNQETVSAEIPVDSELFKALCSDDSPGNSVATLKISAEISAGKETQTKTFTKNLSEKQISLLAEYLLTDSEFIDAFYWRDFPEKPQEIIFMKDGAVLHGIPSDMFSYGTENFSSDLVLSLSESGGSDFAARAAGTVSGDGVFGIYFVNGRYYIRRSAVSEEKLAEIYTYLNSVAKIPENGKVYISNKNFSDTEFIYSICDGCLTSSVAAAAAAKSKFSGSGVLTVTVPTYLNFYTAVFIDNEALKTEFSEYYDSVISKIKNGEIYPSALMSFGGLFEKNYGTKNSVSLSIFYDEDNIKKFISELSPYLLSFEDVGDDECYYISSLVNKIPFDIYLPKTEAVEKILSEYIADCDAIFAGELPKVISMKINETEITDPEDISYLCKGIGLSGSSGTFYTVREIYPDGSENISASICFTEKMKALLRDKYGINIDEETGNENSVSLTVEKGR